MKGIAFARVLKYYIPGKFYAGIEGDHDGDVASNISIEFELQPMGSACEYCSCGYGENHKSILYLGTVPGVVFFPCPHLGQVIMDGYYVGTYVMKKEYLIEEEFERKEERLAYEEFKGIFAPIEEKLVIEIIEIGDDPLLEDDGKFNQ